MRSTTCGVTATPSFATAAYAVAICIGVTAIPCPMGTVPIVEPDHWESGSTMPELSPGKSTFVFWPKPKRWIQPDRRSEPTFSASVTAPTLEECESICPTVSVSVPRRSAS